MAKKRKKKVVAKDPEPVFKEETIPYEDDLGDYCTKQYRRGWEFVSLTGIVGSSFSGSMNNPNTYHTKGYKIIFKRRIV